MVSGRFQVPGHELDKDAIIVDQKKFVFARQDILQI
jgi:hypothetical protein